MVIGGDSPEAIPSIGLVVVSLSFSHQSITYSLRSHNQTITIFDLSSNPSQPATPMEAVSNALLATCESSIKSLAQSLITLHSIDALHRLKEKEDVVEAISIIASFTMFLLPPPAPAPAPHTVVDDVESSIEARLKRLEHWAELLRHGRLATIGEQQEDTTAHVVHATVLTHPATLEDGRDEDFPATSPSDIHQAALSPCLLHPVRKSELPSFERKEKPLYSFLIHFPVYRALGAVLSVTDRTDLFSLPVMAKWGFARSMAAHAYPRVRLTNKGTACVVVDDKLERLEAIKKDLEETETELWHNATGMVAKELDQKFFIVGTWREEHVALVFSSFSSTTNASGVCPTFGRWMAPGNLWKDILEVYPLVSDYQESAHGREGGNRPLLGAGLFYHKQVFTLDHSRSFHYVTLVVPLLGSPHALMFANDFMAQYSPVSVEADDGTVYTASVRVVKMGPPALKDDANWDGVVLRQDLWPGGVDKRFALYNDTVY